MEVVIRELRSQRYDKQKKRLECANPCEDRDAKAFTYATSKLDAAAVLSASHRQYIFIGTAYTAAHEAMKLLLKVCLKEGAGIEPNEAWGHDLGELFMKWDANGRTEAELAYQRGVL